MDEVTKYKKIYYICGKCGLSDFALRGHWHNIKNTKTLDSTYEVLLYPLSSPVHTLCSEAK